MKKIIKVSGKSFKSESDRSKKTEKADLENKKGIFFEIGLIISLALILFAFEWKSYDTSLSFISDRIGKEIIDELPQITKVSLPEPKIPKPTTIFKPVENTTKDVKDILIDVEVKPDEPNIDYPPIAPTPEPEVDENVLFTAVQENPEYVGGEEARIMFLRKNIVYPQIAREANIQGTVYITFVVEKTGEITNVKLERGIGGGCDEESIRVTKAMPKWKPGKQREKPVRVQYTVPIKFVLSN